LILYRFFRGSGTVNPHWGNLAFDAVLNLTHVPVDVKYKRGYGAEPALRKVV